MTPTPKTFLRPAVALLGAAVFTVGASRTAGYAGAASVPVRAGDTVNVVNQKPVWRDTAELVVESTVGSVTGGENYSFSLISAIAVGPKGQLFVADEGQHAVREYWRGAFVRVIGKAGTGPGAFSRVLGIALTPSGNVVVREYDSSRVSVFAAGGKPLSSWRIPPGEIVGRGRSLLRIDSAGRTMVAMWVGTAKDIRMTGNAVLRVSADGSRRDTLVVSDKYLAGCPMVMVKAPKPIVLSFAPQTIWTVGARGELIAGCSSQYAFDVTQANGRVLRVTRAWTPVLISKQERDDRVSDFERRMQSAMPGWKWTAPPHPTQLPAFSGMFAAEDGRIWVITSLPAEVLHNPAGPQATPARVWRDHYNFDVFSARGVFEGSVKIPEGMRLTTEPVIRADTVWAVTADARGAQFVTRYHLKHAK